MVIVPVIVVPDGDNGGGVCCVDINGEDSDGDGSNDNGGSGCFAGIIGGDGDGSNVGGDNGDSKLLLCRN